MRMLRRSDPRNAETDAYEECNCKILEITMSVVGEVQDGK